MFNKAVAIQRIPQIQIIIYWIKNRGFDLWYVKEYVLGTKQNGQVMSLGIHLDKKDATPVAYTCNGMDFGVLAVEYPWGQAPGIPNPVQSLFQRLTKLRRLAVD